MPSNIKYSHFGTRFKVFMTVYVIIVVVVEGAMILINIDTWQIIIRAMFCILKNQCDVLH